MLIAAVLLLASLPLTAHSETNFAMEGAGAFSCGKFASDPNFRDPTILWTEGFLSGLNTARVWLKRPMLQLPDPDSIGLYLDKFCRDHPLDDIYSGSMNLFIELGKRQAAEPAQSTPIAPQSNGS